MFPDIPFFPSFSLICLEYPYYMSEYIFEFLIHDPDLNYLLGNYMNDFGPMLERTLEHYRYVLRLINNNQNNEENDNNLNDFEEFLLRGLWRRETEEIILKPPNDLGNSLSTQASSFYEEDYQNFLDLSIPNINEIENLRNQINLHDEIDNLSLNLDDIRMERDDIAPNHAERVQTIYIKKKKIEHIQNKIELISAENNVKIELKPKEKIILSFPRSRLQTIILKKNKPKNFDEEPKHVQTIILKKAKNKNNEPNGPVSQTIILRNPNNPKENNTEFENIQNNPLPLYGNYTENEEDIEEDDENIEISDDNNDIREPIIENKLNRNIIKEIIQNNTQDNYIYSDMWLKYGKNQTIMEQFRLYIEKYGQEAFYFDTIINMDNFAAMGGFNLLNIRYEQYNKEKKSFFSKIWEQLIDTSKLILSFTLDNFYIADTVVQVAMTILFLQGINYFPVNFYNNFRFISSIVMPFSRYRYYTKNNFSPRQVIFSEARNYVFQKINSFVFNAWGYKDFYKEFRYQNDNSGLVPMSRAGNSFSGNEFIRIKPSLNRLVADYLQENPEALSFRDIINDNNNNIISTQPQINMENEFYNLQTELMKYKFSGTRPGRTYIHRRFRPNIPPFGQQIPENIMNNNNDINLDDPNNLINDIPGMVEKDYNK